LFLDDRSCSFWIFVFSLPVGCKDGKVLRSDNEKFPETNSEDIEVGIEP